MGHREAERHDKRQAEREARGSAHHGLIVHPHARARNQQWRRDFDPPLRRSALPRRAAPPSHRAPWRSSDYCQSARGRPTSLLSQRCSRIDPGRAPRRQVTGQHRQAGQHEQGSHQQKRIGAAIAEVMGQHVAVCGEDTRPGQTRRRRRAPCPPPPAPFLPAAPVRAPGRRARRAPCGCQSLYAAAPQRTP